MPEELLACNLKMMFSYPSFARANPIKTKQYNRRVFDIPMLSHRDFFKFPLMMMMMIKMSSDYI